MNKIYLSLTLAAIIILTGCSLLPNVNQNVNSNENQNININKNENINTDKNLNTNQSIDNRILLVPDNIKQYCDPSVNLEACHAEKFNHDPANTTVVYRNEKKGISVDLPYNPNWGSENYKINAYDETGNGDVIFGPIGLGEGASWYRDQWTLRFQPAKTADQVISGLDIDKSLFLIDPKKDTINNLEVVEFADAGLTNYYHIIIIGRQLNYEFISIEHLDDSTIEEEMTDLEKIVETVTLAGVALLNKNGLSMVKLFFS